MPPAVADVLVIDDDPQLRALVASLLEARGFAVRRAGGGLDGLELARARVPDLVLLDLQLPDVDGFEVCRRLRTLRPPSQLPVLFISGVQSTEEKVRAFKLGGVDYLTKPFDGGELLARVEAHLGLKRLQEESAHRALELEAANRSLSQRDESRNSFVSAVVHDLKNPLTPVLKNAEWLMARTPDADSESGDVLRDLYLAAHYMNRMVSSLLDVARGASAVLEPKWETVDLEAWAEEAVALTRLYLRGTPERLVVDVQRGTAVFDPLLITRVVQNLLDNALKYAPSCGVLSVRVRTESERLDIAVEDDGPGIPDAAKERIFQPWERVRRAHDPRERESHGLGLAFCRQAVEAHGGCIRIEDRSPHGTRFVVELPRSGGPQPRVAAAGPEE